MFVNRVNNARYSQTRYDIVKLSNNYSSTYISMNSGCYLEIKRNKYMCVHMLKLAFSVFTLGMSICDKTYFDSSNIQD